MMQTAVTSSGFEPVHKAHAIAEMAVIFEFAPTPGLAPAPWLDAALCHQLFGKDFAIELGQVHQFSVSPSGTAINAQNAYILRKGGTPDAPAWLARIEPDVVALHCFAYSRWDQVWLEARGYLNRLMPQLSSASTRLMSLGLRYVDQFNFKLSLDHFDPAKLLRENKHLHSAAFASGARWHCHTGWFDESETPEVLNQLNINSVVPVPGDIVADPLIAIEHLQIIRSQPSANLSRYLLMSDHGESLDNLMQRMHDSNKLVVLELLQPDVAKRINLTSKKRST